MNIKLLGNRVLIEVKEETETSGGLVLQSMPEPGDAQQGRVVAVGPGKTNDVGIVPMNVKEDDNVLFQYGTPVSVEGKSYVLCTEEDVVAIM